MNAGRVLVAAAVSLSLAAPPPAQVAAPPPQQQAPAPASPAAAGAKAFSQQELDQLLAPIALYPDALLAQVLMASTYPLEVVAADRWAKANPGLKDKALEDALQQQSWDPSVKSLAVFPQVLTMMSEKIDWTQKLGDAFLAQQKDVLATAQALRAKAAEQGTLKDTKEQKVTTEKTESTTVIKIEPTNPEVVYVPSYNPTVVYGSWPYPAYPPYSYYPPGYVATAAVSFGLGVACGAAWGYAWGNCNWGGGDVDINNSTNIERNSNIDRDKYQGGGRGQGGRGDGGRGQNGGKFQHDSSHRQGVAYRDQKTADRMGGGASARDTAASRDQFRGRADAGRQDIAKGGADQFKGDRGM